MEIPQAYEPFLRRVSSPDECGEGEIFCPGSISIPPSEEIPPPSGLDSIWAVREAYVADQTERCRSGRGYAAFYKIRVEGINLLSLIEEEGQQTYLFRYKVTFLERKVATVEGDKLCEQQEQRTVVYEQEEPENYPWETTYESEVVFNPESNFAITERYQNLVEGSEPYYMNSVSKPLGVNLFHLLPEGVSSRPYSSNSRLGDFPPQDRVSTTEVSYTRFNLSQLANEEPTPSGAGCCFNCCEFIFWYSQLRGGELPTPTQETARRLRGY